jgi:hypothetical protein
MLPAPDPTAPRNGGAPPADPPRVPTTPDFPRPTPHADSTNRPDPPGQVTHPYPPTTPTRPATDPSRATKARPARLEASFRARNPEPPPGLSFLPRSRLTTPPAFREEDGAKPMVERNGSRRLGDRLRRMLIAVRKRPRSPAGAESAMLEASVVVDLLDVRQPTSSSSSGSSPSCSRGGSALTIRYRPRATRSI